MTRLAKSKRRNILLILLLKDVMRCRFTWWFVRLYRLHHAWLSWTDTRLAKSKRCIILSVFFLNDLVHYQFNSEFAGILIYVILGCHGHVPCLGWHERCNISLPFLVKDLMHFRFVGWRKTRQSERCNILLLFFFFFLSLSLSFVVVEGMVSFQSVGWNKTRQEWRLWHAVTILTKGLDAFPVRRLTQDPPKWTLQFLIRTVLSFLTATGSNLSLWTKNENSTREILECLFQTRLNRDIQVLK